MSSSDLIQSGVSPPWKIEMYVVGNPCAMRVNCPGWRHLSRWQWQISCSSANLLPTVPRIVFGETSFAPTVWEWGNVNIAWKLGLSAFHMTMYDMCTNLRHTCPIMWLVLGRYKSICLASPLKPPLALYSPPLLRIARPVCAYGLWQGIWPLPEEIRPSTSPLQGPHPTHTRWSSVVDVWPKTCIKLAIMYDGWKWQ